MSPNAGRGGESRGLSQWIHLCTWSPKKLWISNSIFNLRLRPTALAQSTVLSPNFLTFKVTRHRFQRVEKLVLEEIDSMLRNLKFKNCRRHMLYMLGGRRPSIRPHHKVCNHSEYPLAGIGTLPPPLSPASVPLPPELRGGGGAHSPAGKGWGESQFRRLEKKLSTLPTLCPYWSTHFQHANKMAAIGRRWKVDSCFKNLHFMGQGPTRFHTWFLFNFRNQIFSQNPSENTGSLQYMAADLSNLTMTEIVQAT